MSTSSHDYRLPKEVTPVHYDLKIWTDLQGLEFEGSVDIQLHVNEKTSKIVLNTLELKLQEVTLHSDVWDTFLHASSSEYDPIHQRATFAFPKTLPADTKARLTVSFRAAITSHLMGYYKSTGGKDGKTIYALTQFQPTAARRAFPCWDEPGLKATFAISMVSRKDTVNLSNMSAASEVVCAPGIVEDDSWLAKKIASLPNPSEWKLTRFDTTPPMSTYIIAYANGPFEHIEGSYKSPLSGQVRPLRLYATADGIGQTNFALEVLTKIMPIYEDMFDIEFPLPKLDILAADDFDLGGMENWGLIVCRAQSLLYSTASNNIRQQQNVASMVGHEVAHMWFGDITTMEWWDNLYLNEGFATLMGDKAILGEVWPEWKPDSEFLGSNFYSARALDAKLSSHPIEVECPDANKILQIFDALSYAKAASVLRMLASYVGQERFLKGVSIYLKKFMYKNTVTKDLWEGIKAATDIDIPKIMDNWIKQMGYPVVNVAEKDGGIHIRQDRFLETGPAPPEHNETIWMIPVSIVTVDENGETIVKKELFVDRDMLIPLDTSKPFKLNSETTGFYAVQYSAERLVKLGQYAAQPNSPFTVSDRIGLVRDAFALARSGHASVGSALGFVNSLVSEKEYYVWDAISTNLSEIASVWYEHSEVMELLNAFRRELFVPLAKRMGLEDSPSDTADEQQLRTTAVEQAASAGDQWVIQELKSRFDHYMETGSESEIPGNLIQIAYKIGVQEGGKHEWDFVLNIAEHPETPSQGVSALLALGATRDTALAEAAFEHAMNGARDQDAAYCARGLSRNAAMRHFLARSVKENFDALEKRYAGTFGMARWIQITFGALSSEEDYEATAAFFRDRDTAHYDMSLRQSLDDIRSRATWIKRSTDELVQWLEQRQK